MAMTGAAMGVKVGFDCGFTPCMFSREFVDAHADMFMPRHYRLRRTDLRGSVCDKVYIDNTGASFDTADLGA